MSEDAPAPEPATTAGPSATDSSKTDTRKGSKRKAAGDDPLRGSRTSGAWAAIVGLGILLILLIIFIAQNTQSTQVKFLGWDGSAPVSVTLLIAAAAGLFIATAGGSLRILQLRRRVKRDR